MRRTSTPRPFIWSMAYFTVLPFIDTLHHILRICLQHKVRNREFVLLGKGLKMRHGLKPRFCIILRLHFTFSLTTRKICILIVLVQDLSRYMLEASEVCISFYPRDVVSAVYATATWLGGWLAGCHTPVLYQNGKTHLKTLSTFW